MYAPSCVEFVVEAGEKDKEAENILRSSLGRVDDIRYFFSSIWTDVSYQLPNRASSAFLSITVRVRVRVRTAQRPLSLRETLF
jgi:hypothetical protein